MSKPELPSAFVKRVSEDPLLGTALLQALDQTAPVSVRVHPHKKTNSVSGKPVPWCTSGYYLDQRPVFTLDPLFHAGCYYPQEAGSMMLDQLLPQLDLPQEPIALDLCAAPGGKSTLLASFLDGKGLLVSNEVIRNRAQILRENLCKWGYTNTLVTNNDPADFERLPLVFDLILVDAPCSGEGMFRKDPDARSEWSPEAVNLCAGRQKRIVADVWEALKPGGFLIYSTCTFNRNENEDHVQWMIQELNAELLTLNYAPFQPGRDGFGAYALPSQVASEGFYVVVLRKPPYDLQARLPKLKNPKVQRVKDPGIFKEFVQTDGLVFFERENHFYALPEAHADLALLILQELHLVKFGTDIGQIFKNKLQPDQALALDFRLLQPVPSVALDQQQALHYLKGDTFPLEAPAGIVLVTHQGIPLGWIKHLGNRFNNLYPTAWRIRMRVD